MQGPEMRAIPSVSGAGVAAQMGSGAVRRVRVVDLLHPQYRGRRVAFGGVVGVFVGLVATTAAAIDADGNPVAAQGPTKLVLRDDHGDEHQLDFVATDTVTVIA